MFSTEVADKLLSISHEINKHFFIISEKLGNISNYEKSDSEIIFYIKKIEKCCFILKQELEKLDEKIELCAKNTETKDNAKVFDNVRHDMLNPINGIIGYSEIILEKSNDKYVVSNIKEIILIVGVIIDLIAHINMNKPNKKI